jgi:hypothetical protein
MHTTLVAGKNKATRGRHSKTVRNNASQKSCSQL